MGRRVGKTPVPAGATTPAPTADQPSEGKAEKPRQTCLHSQLRKTKFCQFHLKGACQFGENCSFAHACAELNATPDLRKTRLCVNFFEGSGCSDTNCGFAHSEDDLRSTDMFYKKTLCVWNEKGRCWNGEQCRFAHSSHELRAHNGMAPSSQRPKEPGATQPRTSIELIGRHVSNETASTSCGNLSTLSASDASGSMAAAKSRPGRRGRCGQQGPGHGAENQPLQARRGKETETGKEAMPMKVLPNSCVMVEPPQPVYMRPAQGGPSAHKETQYNPALQEELLRLRYSVSTLAATCSQLNDQMVSETLKAEASDRMLAQAIMAQRLMEQTRQQQRQYAEAAAALGLLASGSHHIGNWKLEPCLHSEALLRGG